MQNPMRDKAADLLQKALVRARRCGAAAGKIRFVQKQASSCSFEAGRLKQAGDQQSVQITVELVAGGRQGKTTLNDPADLDEMVDRALNLAKAGSAVHFDAYPPAAPIAVVRLHSPRTASLTRQAMIDACGQIAGALKAYNPDLYIEASANRSEVEGVLVTSGGVCHLQTGTRWSLGSYVQRTEGTDMVFCGFGRGWNDLNEFFDPDLISGRILQDLRHSETIVPPMTGRTTVLLSPEMLDRKSVV
jgi:predicted Zn-dependent protease